MLQDIVTKGSTDRSVTLRIIDSADGTPETGVVYNSAGISLWYRREGAAPVDITEVDLAALTTAHTDGGVKHIRDGEYRLDLPDAAFATGANHVDFGGTVTGMIVIGGRVRLTDVNLEDAVRMGLTTLANSAGGTATAATQTTIAGYIDTEISTLISNLAVVATYIDTEVANIQSRLPAALIGGRMDATVSAIDNVAQAAANLRLAFDDTAGAVPWVGIVDQGTAQAATNTTVQIRAAATHPDNALVGHIIFVRGSTQGYWQARQITANVGSTDTVTVDAFTVTPSGTLDYKIFAAPPAPATAPQVQLTTAGVDAILDDPVEGSVTLRQILRLLSSVAAGKVNGAGTGTENFRDLADSKNRFVSTVDASGNRTTVVTDLS